MMTRAEIEKLVAEWTRHPLLTRWRSGETLLALIKTEHGGSSLRYKAEPVKWLTLTAWNHILSADEVRSVLEKDWTKVLVLL